MKNIQHTPGVCGGRACIRNTRIPVWTIILYLRAGCTTAMILADFPTLTAVDLLTAQAWYASEAGQREIDRDFLENQ